MKNFARYEDRYLNSVVLYLDESEATEDLTYLVYVCSDKECANRLSKEDLLDLYKNHCVIHYEQPKNVEEGVPGRVFDAEITHLMAVEGNDYLIGSYRIPIEYSITGIPDTWIDKLFVTKECTVPVDDVE